MTDFVKALSDALSFDIFTDADNILAIHSQDSSVFNRVPTGVLYPRTVQDIQTIVKLATKYRVNLSVRAGGTCMSGGSLTEGYILNLTKNFKNISVNPYAKSAEVDAGVFYRDLEAEMMKHNLVFAAYPSSKDVCGIGGMLGNNASGEKSIRHGATIDNIYSVDVVLFDGELYTFEEVSQIEFAKLTKSQTTLGHVCRHLLDIYKQYEKHYAEAVGDVKKAASGYRLEKIYNPKTKTWNLAKLFIGAQATLGIIVSARLKLVEVSLYRRTLIIPIHNLSQLPAILKTIMGFNPESVETFDKNTYMQAKKFLPEETLHIREFFTPDVELIVIAEFSESTQADTDSRAHAVTEGLKFLTDKVFYTNDPVIINSAWAVRRSAFRVLRDATYDTPHKRAVPCIEDIIVPITKYDVFIPELMAILKKYNIEYGYHGHIGDGALRVIPIIDFSDKQKAVDTINDVMVDVFALVKMLKGNTSADHGDGLIRTPFLRDFYGDALYKGVVIGIKRLFDPAGIFNNDKKVGVQVGDWVGWVR
ncbi:MAG: hypothetical protein RJB39_215 [Candidatus Parcubacteria bacterium]|jgi:FAD/FMN-containing dehydrogenase